MKRLAFTILTSLITTFTTLACASPLTPYGFTEAGLAAYDISVDFEEVEFGTYDGKKHPVEWFIGKIPALDEEITGTCNEYWCYSHPEDMQLVGLNKSYVDAMTTANEIKGNKGKILDTPLYDEESITIGALTINREDGTIYRVRMKNGPSIILDTNWGVMTAYYALSTDNLDIAVLYGTLGNFCDEDWLMVIWSHNFLSVTELPFKCYYEHGHKSAEIIDDVLHITSGDDVFKYKLQ